MAINISEHLEMIQSMTDFPTSGKITFAAYHPRTQLPVTCRCVQDKSGKLYTGQGDRGYYELLTPEEKGKLSTVFDSETAYVLEDGKVLDLDDPFDAAIWKWLRVHPFVALDKDLGKNSNDAVFYVINEQKEARSYVDKTAAIDEARPAVRKLSHNEQIRIAESLGLASAKGFSPEQLLSWLLRKCDSDPDTVLASINPENKAKVNATIFATKFIQSGIVERMKDGLYYFGGADGVQLGHNKEMVIDYLLKAENSERVRAMKGMLAERTKAAVGVTD
jgi:hypothetical protein